MVENKNHDGKGVASFFSDRCNDVKASRKDGHRLDAVEGLDCPCPVGSGALGREVLAQGEGTDEQSLRFEAGKICQRAS